MTPPEIALSIMCTLFAGAAGAFGGLWWGARCTAAAWRTVYDHARNTPTPQYDEAPKREKSPGLFPNRTTGQP